MKLKQLPVFIAVLGLSSFAQADFIGLKGDISYWNVDGKANIDEKRLADQDLDRKGTVQASVAFEHPVPIIPNVKVKYTKLDTETEANTINKTDINLDHTDLILYYEILDNIVKADVGVGATRLNGDVKQFGQSVDVDEYSPIIYAEVGGKLPFTGFSAKAEATYTNVNDVKITDAQAEVQYNFVQSILLDLGAKVGYRVMNIELDDMDKRDMKFEFKGPYIGLDAHF
ncbi:MULTISPECIES: TIGR04219 family outer membrane beta-barrel protein [Acinetobacter]|uniref:TIGR04219 family outer membrane beta-barrel protein n=1 Tax=Acinetobacter piscicola TaxID=2006115 RepID=A0A4Q4GV71_9GAMM|nr:MULTISPECIES: TIGR04219 family outer membrane beta-barrel protein [Acinetobacter]MDM1759221.1 TIGR04219 family outer membrane beta-barrel protein [Acinetobacter sp. 256-1]MDM1762614.1 TIGR04219 family outer membrane beta-barrel protein [Acinetobacter sp. 251-1]QOW44440.1 TIGR04219 family outer membrane beta-barrel protein [Acinetobacter piscicola]RYL20934.1 TIGR04219 family outer membrane beta-barrel protein [Acinetobacter piscicola]